jgi:hypothetical protein
MSGGKLPKKSGGFSIDDIMRRWKNVVISRRLTTTILRHSAHNLQVKDKQFSSIYRPVICVIYKKNDGICPDWAISFSWYAGLQWSLHWLFFHLSPKKNNLYTPFILSKLIQIIPSDLKRKKNHKKQKKKKKDCPKIEHSSCPTTSSQVCVCVFYI